MTPKYIFVAKSCICRIYISFPWGKGINFKNFCLYFCFPYRAQLLPRFRSSSLHQRVCRSVYFSIRKFESLINFWLSRRTPWFGISIGHIHSNTVGNNTEKLGGNLNEGLKITINYASMRVWKAFQSYVTHSYICVNVLHTLKHNRRESTIDRWKQTVVLGRDDSSM